jgi:hypothetical protein
VSAVDKKQQPPVRQGLDDPNWRLMGGGGDCAWTALDLAIRGVRIAYRERGNHTEFLPLDPELPPNGPSRYFFYVWAPDVLKFVPGSQEEQGRCTQEAAVRPRSRKPGRKPTADWKTRVAYYVGCINGSGEEAPTAAKIAEWCVETLGCDPDPSDINKLLKTLRE